MLHNPHAMGRWAAAQETIATLFFYNTSRCCTNNPVVNCLCNSPLRVCRTDHQTLETYVLLNLQSCVASLFTLSIKTRGAGTVLSSERTRERRSGIPRLFYNGLYHLDLRKITNSGGAEKIWLDPAQLEEIPVIHTNPTRR